MKGVEEQARTRADDGSADATPAPYAPVRAAPVPAAPARRPRGLAFELVALGVIAVLLIAALGAGAAVVYDRLYSPAAFVTRYLDLLAQGRAADALELPGVATDSSALEGAGLPSGASDALLRREALAPLRDIRVVATQQEEGGISVVTMSYSAGPHDGATTFRVERAGTVGIAPTWRFAQSPLALVDLTLTGSRQFRVNGFELDTRQASPDGAELDPAASVPLLVFAPGLYSVDIDTPIATSAGVAVLADTPQARTPVAIEAQPTPEFVDVVQTQVSGFLDECATQQVLQPTGCPFGFVVHNRITAAPEWSIATAPTIAVEPDGAGWTIPRTDAVAHIRVDVRSLFDGSVRHVDEDVPFSFTGTIEILPDGAASIQLTPVD
ncbi:hypothetical protein [Microbacterium sp.]|uniref:hypothetical protein n=1 Tax=Microbacterium sp. TaxID=51671 RepID=UPI0039E4B558